MSGEGEKKGDERMMVRERGTRGRYSAYGASERPWVNPKKEMIYWPREYNEIWPLSVQKYIKCLDYAR